MQSIVIDRVRIDDEGTHWVVDYKTGTHEGGDLEVPFPEVAKAQINSRALLPGDRQIGIEKMSRE